MIDKIPTLKEALLILGLPLDTPPAISIPKAGGLFGLSRNGSYEAALRHEMPIMEFGRLKKVPVIPLAMKVLNEAANDD